MPFRKLLKLILLSLPVSAVPVATSSQSQAKCKHPTAFFSQQIDHGSSLNGTFLQQYQIIDDYYKPGGPILFYQGAEGATMECLEGTIVVPWAEELGALAVTLEHRFFGASFPSNESDLSNKYQTLTLENVMLDSVTFVDHLKTTIQGIRDSKTVITGASYGGFLSAVIRLNHPETFYGSVAWAAPVRNFGPDKFNPDRFNGIEHVSNVYLDQSAVGANKIRNALKEFAEKTENNATLPNDIVSGLNLCTRPTTQTEYVSFLQYLVAAYWAITQYSLSQPLVFPVNALPKLTTATVATNNTTSTFQALLDIYAYNTRCADWTGSSGPEALVNVDSYMALACHYYSQPFYYEIPNGTTIFPVQATVPFSVTAAQCSLYGVSASSILTQAEIQAKYHFTQGEIENSTRILFPIGELDPVSGGWGPTPFNWPGQKGYTDRNRSRAWVVSEMAHGEDSLAPAAGDKQSVVHARNVELQSIKEWLGVY